jgi:hypothetical protein
MTDRDVLERLAALTGGRLNGRYTYKGRPTSKPYYRVWISRSLAAQLMPLILPLMGSRRAARIRTLVAPDR